MIYQIYIKSHTDAPDFEIEMEADNFQDLKKKFDKQYDHDLQESDVEPDEETLEALDADQKENEATGN